ncbi:MAG: hypothetical protein JSV80_07035 [Acidobacteriota bacterium]|nr:MAG: hypothetical protein JSV80_07035 [Acidobacteriota bacterium]
MTLRPEYKQILEMLGEGKITTDDAKRLMEKLNSQASSEGPGGSAGEPADAPDATPPVGARPSPRTGSSLPKYLRVLVNSHDGDEVNIRVPLKIVRAGLKLSTVLPQHAREKIQEHGVDLSNLSELDGDELIEALRELSIDVDASNGDTVRIFCE